MWDLGENPYIDASIMGIGTNILGYDYPEVDEAVRTCSANGSLITLNCPKEDHLSEKLGYMAYSARYGREIQCDCHTHCTRRNGLKEGGYLRLSWMA